MSFIGIQLEGDKDFLETSPDTSIALKLENPILGSAEKLSPGAFSLPFNLPGGESSPKNSAKLKNPDVIENNDAYKIQRATLFLGGLPFKSGNLRSTAFDVKKIDSYFTFGLGSLNSDLKNAKLKDVLNEQINIDTLSHAKKIYVKINNISNTRLAVNGKDYDGHASDVRIAINGDLEATLNSGKFMPYCTVVESGTSPSGLIAAPFFEIKASQFLSFFDPDLNMTFFHFNDSVDPLVELDVSPEEGALCEVAGLDEYFTSFTNFMAPFITGAYPHEKFRFPLMFNAGLHENIAKKTELINGVSQTGLILNAPNYGLTNGAPGDVLNMNSLQPFLKMKYVLDKIANRFGFSYAGDFYENANSSSRLLDNSVTLDSPLELFGKGKFIFWRRNFNLSELVPDIKVIDFFKALQSRYNLGFDLNEKTKCIHLYHREQIAKSTNYTEITRLCSPITNVADERITGFTVKVPKEESDVFSEDQEISVGVPEKDIEIKFGTILKVQTDSISGAQVNGLYVSRKNNAKFNLRTFHYRGMVSNGVFSYPSATTNSADFVESLFDSGFIVTEPGIYNRLWKYWLHFEMNRLKIKLIAHWPLRSLLDFEWDKKYRFNGNNYLVKSIDLKASNLALQVTGVELLTMR